VVFDMAGTASVLVKWIRMTAFVCVGFGMLGILYGGYMPHYWYRGLMGAVGVIAGCVGLYASTRGRIQEGQLYLYSLIFFTLILGFGNIFVLLKTRNLLATVCTSTEDVRECEVLRLEVWITAGLIAVAFLIVGPFIYIAKKYVRSLEIEGPIRPDSHAEALVSP